jgi:hypothetical protein
MRWAVARRARTVARCSSDLAGRLRSVAQERICLAVGRPHSPGAQLLRCPHDQRLELVGGVHPDGNGTPSGGQQHPQRLPMPALPGRRQPLGGKRVFGGADRVGGIGLGAGAAGWPLGPADLHDPLVMLEQAAGQPSPVAASTLDRPAAPARDLDVGELSRAR